MIERIKKNILAKSLWIFENSSKLDDRNIKRRLQRNALAETAEYVEQNMIKTRSFDNKFNLIKYSLDLAENNGLIMEFGVWKGTTINFISSNIEKPVYGFDSFEGLPEDWRDEYEKGAFKMDELPIVNKNVKLIKGWFEDSIPPFISENQEYCSFIHIDCDLYTSTKTIFNYLADRIKEGTVILFDEFFNYPGWKDGEFKAFMEFVESNEVKFEYVGYSRYDEQVAVKILGGLKNDF